MTMSARSTAAALVAGAALAVAASQLTANSAAASMLRVLLSSASVAFIPGALALDPPLYALMKPVFAADADLLVPRYDDGQWALYEVVRR